jgi:O-antigen ligase
MISGSAQPMARVERRLVFVPAALVAAAAVLGGPIHTTGSAAFALASLLAVAVVLAVGARLPGGEARAWWAAVGGLAGICIWSLLSAWWSGAPGRAVAGFDQIAPYPAAFILGGVATRTLGDAERVLHSTIAALAAISTVGLMSRLLPSVWPIPDETFLPRLSYPVGYWNSMGLIAAVAFCGCFAVIAQDATGRRRDLAAAALPLCAGALYFTFSRAAIAALLLGLVAVAAIARPGGRRSAMAASLPVSLVIGGGLLFSGVSSSDPTSPAAVREGAALAVIEVLAIAAAVRLARRTPTWRIRVPVRLLVALGVGTALAGAGLLLALGGSTRPSWDDNRTRLLSVGDAYRTQIWRLGWEAFREQPLRGEGAGTFELGWLRSRPLPIEVPFQHNVLLDVLGELGLVGIGLLAVTLASAARPLLRLAPRSPGAALVVVLAAMWLLASAVDYHWRVPAATVWLWATLGAFAAVGNSRLELRLPVRRAVAVAVAVAGLVPATMAMSQILLRQGADAIKARDAVAGARWARYARWVAPYRAGPPILEAYAWLSRGQPARARAASAVAARRDPRGWEPSYIQAVAASWLGEDAQPLMLRAHVRNEKEYAVFSGLNDVRAGRRVTPMFGEVGQVDGWF